MRTLIVDQPLRDGKPEFEQGEVVRIDGQIFLVLIDSSDSDELVVKKIGGKFIYKVAIEFDTAYSHYSLGRPYKDTSYKMPERSISFNSRHYENR